MYNLAERKGLPKTGDTPDHVAANTYILDHYKTFKQNYAPFLSKTKRDFSIGRKLYTQAVYNAEIPTRHIKGGSSIRNNTNRCFFHLLDTPGPADYDPKKITKKKPLPSNLPPPGKPKLYLGTPPHLSNAVPSIPTKVDENGYYINEFDEIVKIPADEHDTTLGPAFYDIPVDPFYGTNKYKGCEWSKRSAKRNTIDVCNNPGPGTYNIETDLGRMDPRDEYVREMARLFSHIPRTLEANELRILKENLPGPGQYDTNKSTLKDRRGAGINPSPLIAGAKRFKYSATDTPAPNAYNVQDKPKRGQSILSTPFGMEAERSATLHHGSGGPGPADYKIKSSIGEKLTRKGNYYLTTQAPFNTTAKRKIDFVEEDSLYMPGPANYIVEPLQMERKPIYCCHFRSTTKRFPKARSSENAEPATYSISETFNKNRNRTSHNTGKVPFQTTQPKSTKRISDNPGPADYLGHVPIDLRSKSFSRSPRFQHHDAEVPGPGAYHIEPGYSDSIFKSYATFNLRLKENVLRQKLRLPPGKTWDNWYKELKKKKKLKCFSTFEKRMYDYVSLLFKGI